MSSEFNPYREWLGIPVSEQPANYYRLLGLPLYEPDPKVISNSANRQMAFVRTFQTGQYAQQAQQLVNELAVAQATLLDKRKKTQYDAKLRAEQNSDSNGETGVVSSLGSYSEVHSVPPPFTASQVPPPWSNNYQGTQSLVTPPENAPVPPIPNTPNPPAAFLKKYWIALLSAFIVMSLFICGGGLLVNLLKTSKTDVAQNADNVPSSDAVQLAKQHYEQSVELQEKEDYDEALYKINVAVALQPNNEQYIMQQQALTHIIKTLGKSKTPTAPVSSEEQSEQSRADASTHSADKPVSTQPKDKPEETDSQRPANSLAEEILQSTVKTMTEAETKAEAKRQAKVVHNEAAELQKDGKYIQAAEKLNEALKLDPDNEQYKEEKSQFENWASAEQSYKESVELKRAGQYAEALVKIEDALAIDPNNEDFIEQKLNIQTEYYKQYVKHRIQREYLQALAKIDKAVELVPKEEFYKEEKQKTEQLVKAVEQGKRLPEKDPDYGKLEEDVENDDTDQPRGFEPGNEAGERKVVNVDGVEVAFRWCPPGTFIMGSPTTELGRKDDEKQHEVELTKGFWIMETQITVGMFKAFVKDTGYESKGITPYGLVGGKWKQDANYSWLNPGFVQTDNNPVTCISWRDAAAFSKWLGGKIESNTKLPTEAQWEYACRAGSKSAYSWGNALNGDKANCNGNYPYGTNVKGPYLEKSAPVRLYPRNAWGVYEMHGNVWEWCQDGYSAYPNDKVSDPLQQGDGTNRVFRGGSWSFKAERCRSAFRASFVPAIRLSNMGGRCVVEPRVPIPKDQGDFSAVFKNAGDRVVKVINGVEFAFRLCPAGSFMMGSPKSEKGRKDDEIQHKVILTTGFWMMETEVTQKQWKAIMGKNPSDVKSDDLPVKQVSWNDCQKFCKKCAELGLPVQLPTESQWEYACRAGTTGAYAGDMNEMTWEDSKNHPVGTKKPNAWGLYDMHGNVLEWCQDWYGEYPNRSANAPVPDRSYKDPVGPSGGSARVCRGGCMLYAEADCRSAKRDKYSPDYGNNCLGFRCVRPIGSKLKSTDKNKDIKTDEPKDQGDFSAAVKSAGDRAVKVINGVEFAFRWCPPGTFMMGRPIDSDGNYIEYRGEMSTIGAASEKFGRHKDGKQHQVTLTKGFWMLETEVTQKQWKAVMGTNPSYFAGDDLPVEHVSWDDCQEFCKKCKALGFPVRLPTEAQWEYACRAGTTGEYAGNLGQMAWFSEANTQTHPVGTKKPNAWGLYDMHGNVWEWCQDRFGDYPNRAVKDPVGSSDGFYRVGRGGCWLSYYSLCRSESRSYYLPDCRYNGMGLRVVKGQ